MPSATTATAATPVLPYPPRACEGDEKGSAAVAPVAPRHEPTIRQNPMVARRTVLDAVDEAVDAVERVIARRDEKKSSAFPRSKALFWALHHYETFSPRVCVPARISPSEE